MLKPKRFFVNTKGINIFCRDTASSGPTILCLHGLYGRGETWRDFMLRYHDKYRIVAPDQRGHGLSDKPIGRYAPQDFAADANDLIQQLGCSPAIVVGHSMGGRVAGFLAALFPQSVKALAILDVGAYGPDKLSNSQPHQIPQVDELTANWPTPYPTYEDAVQHLSSQLKRETNIRYYLQSLTETAEGYDFMFSRYAIAATLHYRQSWYHLIPQIQCPVLLVRATESWELSVEEADKMKSLLKNYTYAEVSNSDHMVHVDNPEEFYKIFDRFLETTC
jgi:pimeloyl-ACP methyl ester carboxylesterase